MFVTHKHENDLISNLTPKNSNNTKINKKKFTNDLLCLIYLIN